MMRWFLCCLLMLVGLPAAHAQSPSSASTSGADANGAAEASASSTVVPTAADADRSVAAERAASVHYVVERRAILYRQASTDNPYMELGFREPLQVLGTDDGWHQVRTSDGMKGYVKTGAISNVWVRVSKQKKTVYVYEGTTLRRTYPADFGYNAFADKERRGSTTNPDDWRTPEGVFFVVRKNPHSKYYKAFVLNYPNAEDAERGRQQGLISDAEYRAIVDAERRFDMPPMHTALGGWIEIHGDGTGVSTNWTQGCVAIHNDHIDEMWEWIEVGTPVLVER